MAYESRQIMILGEPWKLEYRKLPGWTESAGYYDADQRLIAIDPKNADDDSLLHELLHAVSEILGVDLAERDVRVLARGLFAVMQDNEGLL